MKTLGFEFPTVPSFFILLILEAVSLGLPLPLMESLASPSLHILPLSY